MNSSGRRGRRVPERRLDLALVERGLASSRSAAARAVHEGRVLVNGRAAERVAATVEQGDRIELTGDEWVGRGALKLLAALDGFGIDVAGRWALDLGASTGGFTQVLLHRGARQVVALDVGHRQLAPLLRADPRVRVVEGVNARTLDAAGLARLSGVAEPPEVVTADLSFISLRQVLPVVAGLLAPAADVVLLVKPQFEVGRGGVRDGLVRDPDLRARAVRGVLTTAESLGLRVAGLLPSPITGGSGNREALAHLTTGTDGHRPEWDGLVERATRDPGTEVSR